MKVTITKITRNERTSQRTGKPFTSLGLKTQEHGDKWLSGFGSAQNRDWREGDQVDIDIKEVEKDGKVYLNFDTPKAQDKLASELSAILTKLGKMDYKLDTLLDRTDHLGKTSTGEPMPDFGEDTLEPPEELM